MGRLWIFLALLLCLHLTTLQPLLGQDRPFPYALDGSDWVLAPVSLALGGVGWYTHHQPREVTREEIRGLDPGRINAFDRGTTNNWSPAWAHRSDVARGLLYGSAALLLGVEGIRAASDGRSDDALTLGAVFGEAALLTGGITWLTKVFAGRKRPFLYNSSLSVEERYQIASSQVNTPRYSFFSGHASGAFAAATFTAKAFQDIHGPSAWSGLVWGSTLSLATLTAYARVRAGVHFPTDVLLGALVGGGIGYLVPHLAQRDDDPRPSGGGVMLGFGFRF